MNDFKSMILSAMSEGKTIEDIMSEISNAANTIQQEKSRAQKYASYEQILDMEGSVFLRRLGTATAISLDDMAIVFAHFLCQNVKGYAAFCAKEDKDPVKIGRMVLDNYLTLAKSEVDTDGKSDEEKLATILDSVFTKLSEQLAEAVSEEISKDKEITAKNSSNIPGGKSDTDKVTNFLREFGLM